MKKIVSVDEERVFCDFGGCKNRAADRSSQGNARLHPKDFCYTHKPMYDLAFEAALQNLESTEKETRYALADEIVEKFLEAIKKANK